jgi:secreted PhoX family phosphatase
LAFTPIEPSILDDVVVPGGYAWEVLVRWGEPILEGAPGFDFNAQTPAAQAGQFGYNCDYVAFIPTTGTEGVLWVNHEFTNPEIMFPDWNQETSTRAHVEIEMAALGGSVVAVERVGPGRYRFAPGHQRNRRITVFTPMEITGPAAGAELLETSEDPTGTRVLGTLNNCAGGLTPWGTILTCAGNFDEFFANVEAVTDPRIRALHDRIGFNEGPHRADGSCTIPVSTSARSPRSHSGSAGSWRSIPATRRSCHASARRSGGSSTKPRRRRSHGTGGSRSTSVTTSGSSTSTSS